MLTNYKDIYNNSKTVNLVNSDDEKLKQLGLKPLYVTLYPRYINLHGNIYWGGFTHYQCDLSYDVEKMLSIINSNSLGLSVIPKEESLEHFYLEMKNHLKPYTNPSILNRNDVRNWINKNANLFIQLDYPWDMTGVYNLNAMNIINSILETKLEIYTSLYNLAKESNDRKKLVHKILVEFNVYHNKIEYNNPFSDEAIKAQTEIEYWLSMFRNASSDILVQLIGLDKIETQLRKTITTTKPNIYEEFYNLILLGYDIVQLPKLIFDNDKGCLRWINPNDLITTGVNRECERELSLIKKYVPYDKWYQFLRD